MGKIRVKINKLIRRKRRIFRNVQRMHMVTSTRQQKAKRMEFRSKLSPRVIGDGVAHKRGAGMLGAEKGAKAYSLLLLVVH